MESRRTECEILFSCQMCMNPNRVHDYIDIINIKKKVNYNWILGVWTMNNEKF